MRDFGVIGTITKIGSLELGDIPESATICLAKVVLDGGGCDHRGRYWGLGDPLFVAWAVFYDYCQFVRAADKDQAIALLNIPPDRIEWREIASR